MKPLKITFLLPGSGHVPAGGSKVVYEYANHLSRRGHRVTLVHPARVAARPSRMQVVRGALVFAHRCTAGEFRPKEWFPLDAAVRMMWVPTLASRFIPQGDAVLATAWATAEWLADYPATKGQKFYLIQSWETWSGPEERVRATWKAPLKRIVIARWLQDMAGAMGIECTYIPNGIDGEQFGLDSPIEERDPNQMMMLYHPHPVKGSADGLEALSLLKRELPDLHATLFGTSLPKPPLPKWMDYWRLPSQPKLRAGYNRAAIFIAPSHVEGWPLPPAEAMICGAAVAATDIGGHREYGIDGQTALFSPPSNPEKLAENVMRMIGNRELRIKIAKQGHEHIRKCSWDNAVGSFERLLNHSCLPQGAVSPALLAAIGGTPSGD